MYKLSTMLHGLLLVISAATSSTYASRDEVADPKGLLRVSSNLYEQLNEQLQEGDEPITPVQDGLVVSHLLEEGEAEAPSNNNARKDHEAKETNSPLRAATKDEKEAILEYLFVKENRFDPALRQLNPRLKIKPLLMLLRALHQGKEMTAAKIASKVHVEGTSSYKLCSRYKDKGFIQYHSAQGVYSLTPSGQFLLENIEESYKPNAGKEKKRVKQADEDGQVEQQKKANAPAPSKKLRKSEKSDSDELDISKFKRPEVHHALLEAMGTSGQYKDPEAIYDGMGDNQPDKSWAKCKDNFIHHYLKKHVTRGWLITKTVRDHEEYALTQAGIKARESMAKQLGADEDEVSDLEAASTSSSSFEPKKKRDRAHPSSSDVEDDDEEDKEQVKVAPAPEKKTQAANPAPAKKSKQVPANRSQAQPPVDKAQQPAGPQAAELVVAKGLQPAHILDDYPVALRDHLLGQIMQEPDTEAYLNGLQETVLNGIYRQLGGLLVKKFETEPGNALKEYLREHLTITIKKNN